MIRRVVLLSGSSSFSRSVLAALRRRGEPVDALLLYRSRPPSIPSVGGPVATAHAALRGMRAAGGRLRDRLDPRLRIATDATCITGELNTPGMIRDLESLRPDVVVLARCRLLEPGVLRVPTEGTVGVHPALLPWIRGSGAVEHSLLRGVPLGATAFRVDEGIDTGGVIERRLLRVPGDVTPASLTTLVLRLWVEMTVDLVAAVRRAGIPHAEPQPERFPVCRRSGDPAETRAYHAAIDRGDPRALYLRHVDRCDATGRLPADVTGWLLS
jgi:methionyl-tRNA formyltransferase